MKKKCNHYFWKDENPPQCFNCGKTKEELYIEHIKMKIIKKTISQDKFIDILMPQLEYSLPDKLIEDEKQIIRNNVLSLLKQLKVIYEKN